MPVKALFLQKPVVRNLFLALIAVSFSLIYIDTTTPRLNPVRYVLGSVVSLGQWTVESPYRVVAWATEALSTRAKLLARLNELEERNLELARLAVRYEVLRTENDRIRELLGSRAQLSTDVVIAELIGVVSAPDTQQVIIDKGSNDGVRIGYAVLDARGLFGQVVEIHNATARVLLITDLSHAVPVEVNRNGLRGVVAGTGRADLLWLENVPATADIRQGDLLVSSGLGGRFPRGYAVGLVQAVVAERDLAFLQVSVEPSAMLSRSRYLLVLIDAVAGEPQ